MAKTKAAGWEYRVTLPMLPAGATSPVMNSRQMEGWLNEMDARGWEFVGYAQTIWNAPPHTQQWWIFRRPIDTTVSRKP